MNVHAISQSTLSYTYDDRYRQNSRFDTPYSNEQKKNLQQSFPHEICISTKQFEALSLAKNKLHSSVGNLQATNKYHLSVGNLEKPVKSIPRQQSKGNFRPLVRVQTDHGDLSMSRNRSARNSKSKEWKKGMKDSLKNFLLNMEEKGRKYEDDGIKTREMLKKQRQDERERTKKMMKKMSKRNLLT